MRANAMRYTLCLRHRWSVYCMFSVCVARCLLSCLYAYFVLFFYYYFIPLFHFLVYLALAMVMCVENVSHNYSTRLMRRRRRRQFVVLHSVVCSVLRWCVWFLFWILLLLALFILLVRFIPINTSRTCAIKNRFFFRPGLLFSLFLCLPPFLFLSLTFSISLDSAPAHRAHVLNSCVAFD